MTTPYGSNYVGGEGPMPARVCLIGEGPGETENNEGRPFCGKSGQLLDRILFQNGLKREEIYVTNLVKFRVPNNGDPTAEDIARDQLELQTELAAVEPEYIGLLGHFASRHFLSDIHLEWAHGLQFHFARKADMMPMYHPAFGLHSPAMLPFVADDIHQFSLMVKGQLEVRSHDDAHPKPRYTLIKDHGILLQMYAPVYIDTEGSVAHPWGLSFTQRPGFASVILADNKTALKMLQAAIIGAQCQVVLHNAMHDIPVLRVLGIEFDNFRDTMITAYHLSTEPQGLKPLARRHAGMLQDSYDDVIRDARRVKCTKYFSEALRWLDRHWVEESETFSRAAKKKKAAKKRVPTMNSDGAKSARNSRKRLASSSRVSAISRKQRSTTSR